MQWTRECLQGLPPLAWVFVWPCSGEAILLHGSAVEVMTDGFFEGCFAGEIGRDFTQLSEVFGSGIKVSGSCCVLVTPSHTIEGIFLYRHRGGWGVSNSLSLLLEYHGVALPWDPHYGAKFASVSLGIDTYQRVLFQTHDGEVLRIAHHNVEFRITGEYRLVSKPQTPNFNSYQTYIGYLEDTLRRAFASAANPVRRSVYRPLATCSTGYDSAAVAALAHRLGCVEAVTLNKARGGVGDSGRPIGEALGLNVHEVDRPEAVRGSFAQVAQFLATGMGGEDYCYYGFLPFLERKIMLTGFHGDKIWEASVQPNAVLARGDVSGGSLQEFRIRRNFLHIPVPMIGALRHADIAAISRSPEMVSYRLNNKYDRPIPRRILEESGIPRMMFGQSKKAASLLLFHEPVLLDKMTRSECESLVPSTWVKMAKSPLRNAVWHSRAFLSRVVKQPKLTVHAARALMKIILPDWRVFEHSHPMASIEFCAAIALIREDYRRALDNREPVLPE